MEHAKPLPTPMVGGLQLSTKGGDIFQDSSFHNSIVGGLQYVTITRPKIAFSINRVYQYIHRLFDTHWKAVKRILRYLKGTSHLGA